MYAIIVVITDKNFSGLWFLGYVGDTKLINLIVFVYKNMILCDREKLLYWLDCRCVILDLNTI